MINFFIFIIIASFVGGIIAAAMNANKLKEISEIFGSLEGFSVSQEFCSGEASIAIDNKGKKICIIEDYKPKIYSFSDLIKSELVIDGQTVSSNSIGRAVVGGVLAGGVGAIVGATSAKNKEKISSIKLRLTFNDLDNPVCKISFLEVESKKGGFMYNLAIAEGEKWEGMMSIVIDQSK